MIDVRKLRLLVALQRLGTLAAVAEEMHLSAPGVSMQLAALEKELAIRLTQRQGRRLVLTAAGVTLADHGRDVLDRLSLAELELQSLRAGTVGRYTLAAFPSASRTIVADAFREILSDAGPALDVHLTVAEPDRAINTLMTGDADLAIIHSYSNVPRDLPDSLWSRSIGSEPVWLAAPTARPSADKTVRLDDFSSMPWIAPTTDVTCYTMMERACGLAGFRPDIVAESMDFAVQLELVAAGVGVALVPALTVTEIPDGVELLDLTMPVTRSLHLAMRTPDQADPGIANLCDTLARTATRRLSITPTA
ncbi:LysR family transcriptional regulator [Microbacterium arabinogalactanolyticum]|uniref:LysR family transcriptional regulator n=1 Tax=Microbacterium arabinogalactanolyticum TaxID=69365 RepID=UPI002557664D|nr:LysR family transcriptional regulator [Microbacterium arabinogalactanolyticum]GLC85531.1 LysR family transcriptional regulator [Microbacterium arabinogalactanolyticum]